MPVKTKQTSPSIASLASQLLADPNSSEIAKKLAGSALSQVDPTKQTGAELETLASKALQDGRVSETTQALAASILAQANKQR